MFILTPIQELPGILDRLRGAWVENTAEAEWFCSFINFTSTTIDKSPVGRGEICLVNSSTFQNPEWIEVCPAVVVVLALAAL